MNFTEWMYGLDDMFDEHINPWFEGLPLVAAYPLAAVLVAGFWVYWICWARWRS